jgi:Spy/CpxP family protein refolding chaperone
MKKHKNSQRQPSARKHKRLFRVAIFAAVVLALAAVTVIAKYASPRKAVTASPNASATDDGFVTVNVGGKKIRVNARTMQQGPLTQEQSQQIADALTNNKSSAGLVEVKHADGTIEMDLQGRFQNVMLAKKSDDGRVSTACVDNSDAARAFLQNDQTTSPTTGGRKAAIKE